MFSSKLKTNLSKYKHVTKIQQKITVCTLRYEFYRTDLILKRFLLILVKLLNNKIDFDIFPISWRFLK